jgi:8-amino-7-oxononanoate synthase
MHAWQTTLRQKLEQHRQNGLLRTLKQENASLADFTSNDYLGLAHSQALAANIYSKLSTLALPPNGATGSRLLSGNSNYTRDVEQKLAALFKSESTLIFNSGYSANLAVLSAIPQRHDTILYDELAHACIKDGARLNLAKHHSFRHNDLDDLELKLKRAEGQVFIAVESIYSMDGDVCPLADLVTLAETYNAAVILDEAHSTGVEGTQGSGLSTALGLQDRIAIRVFTFGKAMGIHGACVAGSTILTDYLINHARPFIYTTALPPHSIASIDCAFEYLQQHADDLQQTLKDNINHFLSGVDAISNRTASTSAIQTAIFPGNAQARHAAQTLQAQGFDVRPILSPTVPAGSERLRICLHTYNTHEEITALTSALSELAAKAQTA